MLRCLTFLFILFLTPGIQAQNSAPQYKHFGIEDGLPSKETYQVFQDSRGFIWVATDRGVVRYNGVNFELFNKERGMPDNVVFRFYEDDKARIWFIPLTGNLSYFDGESVIEYAQNKIIQQHIKGLIRSLQVADGHVSIGSLTGALHIETDGTYQLDTLPPKDFMQVNYLNKHEKGVVFCGTPALPSINNTVKISWNSLSLGTFDRSTSKTNADFRFASTEDGVLIFSLLNKIFIVESDGTLVKQVTLPGPVTFITIIDQSIWVGAEGNGAFAFDFQGLQTQHLLTDLSVSYVLLDQQGTYWFSTLENGVYSTCSFQNKRLITSSKINDELILFMDGGENDLLMCDRDGNLLHIDGNDTHYFRIKDIPSPAPVQYIEDEQVYVIFSIRRVIYDPLNKTVNQLPKKIKTFQHSELPFPVKLKGTAFWGETLGSIICFKNDHMERILLHKDIGHITVVDQLDNGIVYLGTFKGLYVWNSDGVHKVSALKNDRIVDIYCHGNRAFVATRGNGLFVLEEDKIDCISEERGLLSNELTSISPDPERNQLWVGSTRGAQLYDIKKNRIIKSYSSSNGLAGNDVYDIHATQNNVFIATNNGVSILKTPVTISPAYDIPFYFLSYTVNSTRKLLPISNQQIELEYMEQLSEIEFAYLDYTSGTPVHYEYLLEGYSDTWNATQNNTLQFIGLPPGQYLLKVRKTGEKHFISIPIYIKAPLWQKTWFIVVVGMIGFLLISGIVYVIYRNRFKRRRAEQEALTLQQTALTSQMNPHFLFNSLNSIQGYIFKNRPEESTRYLSKFSKLIRTILESSVETSISLTGELRALEQYTELENMRMKGRFKYSIENNVTLNPEHIRVPPLILQPFVENAIWHGLASMDDGELLVRIWNDEERLYFSVDDNGVGRKRSSQKEKIGTSRGATISESRMKNFCQLHESKHSMKIIDKQDSEGKSTGTRVEFSITLVYDKSHNH